MTIHKVSKLVGVSAQTPHHYDTIGLLPSTTLTETSSGCMATALARMQSIPLFQELEFPLTISSRLWMIQTSIKLSRRKIGSNFWNCGEGSWGNSSPSPVRF